MHRGGFHSYLGAINTAHYTGECWESSKMGKSITYILKLSRAYRCELVCSCNLVQYIKW